METGEEREEGEKLGEYLDMDLNLISDGFSKREKELLSRREQESQKLEDRFQDGKLTPREFKEEKNKLERWTKHELLEI